VRRANRAALRTEQRGVEGLRNPEIVMFGGTRNSDEVVIYPPLVLSAASCTDSFAPPLRH
jgi:hypothetical protein